MEKAETADVAVRSVPWWRGLVIYVAVAALVITLADRVFHLSIPETSTAQCHSPRAKIQHRDKDAHRWAAPVAHFLPLPAPSPARRVMREHDPLQAVQVDGSLYDRPPPIS